MWGLLKGRNYSRSNVLVKETRPGERSAYAAKDFKAGDFVCEYAACVKEKERSLAENSRYEQLHLGNLFLFLFSVKVLNIKHRLLLP